MTAYQLQRQKKRTLISFLSAFLFHLLLIGGLLIYNLLFVEKLEEFSGPVLVKLGEPRGADLPQPPEPAELIETPEETAPEIIPALEEALVPTEASIPEESSAALPETTRPPELKTPSESQTQKAEKTASPEAVVQKPVEPQPVKIEGSENGNAYETVFSTEEGNVGRNIWIPISLYMPLPVELERRYLDNLKGDSLNTADEYRKIILRYYKEDPRGGYYLNGPVSFDERRTVWVLLEQGGYDLSEAEYKQGRVLRPVVLSFYVLPKPEEGKLVDVYLEKSSGYSDLDEAVKYGFQASSYFNATDRKIKGRFTYRFD